MDLQLYVIFSLAVDILLIIVLIFPWFKNRQNWYAFSWAYGQASMSAGIAISLFGNAGWIQQIILALLLTLSIVGFSIGTECFIGNNDRKNRHRVWMASSCFAILTSTLWIYSDKLIASFTALALGCALLWSGYRLVSYQNNYRWLGYVLIVRGFFNVLNAFDLVPLNIQYWFVFSVLVKTVSILCLIYAVQEKNRQRYVHAINSLSSGFVILDLQGYIHVINEAGAQLLGYPKATALVGEYVAGRLLGVNRHDVETYFQDFSLGKRGYPMVDSFILRHQSGVFVSLEVTASPYIEQGRLYCMMQILDISERKKKDEQLFYAANYDSVTGCLNRYGLVTTLSGLIARCDVDLSSFSILVIDINRFKRFIDSFGHIVADSVLKQVSERLKKFLRPSDLLGRLSGDQFVIVLTDVAPGESIEAASYFSDLVLGAFSQSFTLTHQSVKLSASIGIANYPEHGSDPEELIRNADIAMSAGRNADNKRYSFFEKEMTSYARDAMIDSALRAAISGNELHLVYQPIVDAYSNEVKKIEVLLRWSSCSFGTISPDRFIPIAEQSDLIVELGTWVLNQACHEFSKLKHCLDSVRLSINISSRQLIDPEFFNVIDNALSCNHLLPQQLELELTERVLIDDGPSVQSVLSRLSTLGVGISLDDFGTGYSSLSYLTRFQINTIKIDRSFVFDMETSLRHKNLVAAIIAMAHSLEMEIVAEGVETQLQADSLTEMACHYLQGYLISRPVLFPQLEEFVINNKRLSRSDTGNVL